MGNPIKITVLSEDTAQVPRLLPEHGLVSWIELGGRRVVFDTGQGRVLAHNAFRLCSHEGNAKVAPKATKKP